MNNIQKEACHVLGLLREKSCDSFPPDMHAHVRTQTTVVCVCTRACVRKSALAYAVKQFYCIPCMWLCSAVSLVCVYVCVRVCVYVCARVRSNMFRRMGARPHARASVSSPTHQWIHNTIQ